MTRSVPFAVVVALSAACSEGRGPVTPSLTPPPAVFVVSGTVYEYGPFGRRPLANVPIEISPRFSSLTPQYVSDVNGRYRAEVPGWMERTHKVRAWMSGYRQPCRLGVALQEETTADVHLVSDAVLSTSGLPSALPAIEPWVTGRVFERDAAGERPVAGASVSGDFSAGLYFSPDASTLTDASGRYLLCGVTGNPELNVFKAGYEPASASVDLGRERYDFELKRR